MTRALCSVAMQADNALQCFLEVIAQIAEKRTEIILRRKLPRLFMAYPNYRLALGFGLHHGWAIEGSLGSMHKVRFRYCSSGQEDVIEMPKEHGCQLASLCCVLVSRPDKSFASMLPLLPLSLCPGGCLLLVAARDAIRHAGSCDEAVRDSDPNVRTIRKQPCARMCQLMRAYTPHFFCVLQCATQMRVCCAACTS